MDRLRRLEPLVWVSGQIDPCDLPGLADAGFGIIVNHRPDFEEAGQPLAAELEAAARASGLGWVHAPVNGWPGPSAVEATAAALADMPVDGKALLFCRSGMRSAVVWALARAAQGVEPDKLRKAAADAGYDLSRVPL